ncbi:MAG: alpha/beta fold hydrolase [Saprospiraceae bacterium]|nr:alpha/beta fold hydrolase [Saprospiraceae bacterium]
MPLEFAEEFRRPWFIRGAHPQTIFVNLFRKPTFIRPEREKVLTPDGDFFLVDWYKQGSKKCIIIAHGLEGDSKRQYVRGLGKTMFDEGWDVLAKNFRSCGGKINYLPGSYHCAHTQDLELLVDRIQAEGVYDTLVLAGFSLGGNVSLLYAGRKASEMPSVVKAVVGVSVPCDLVESVDELDAPKNRHYLLQFFRPLKNKVRQKVGRGIISKDRAKLIYKAKNFRELDEVYTAPLHGFDSARDYWAKASSLSHLTQIRVPSLLINAMDDTFISKTCFPTEIAKSSPDFHLVIPPVGGHVGFVSGFPWTSLWSEQKIKSFLIDTLSL